LYIEINKENIGCNIAVGNSLSVPICSFRKVLKYALASLIHHAEIKASPSISAVARFLVELRRLVTGYSGRMHLKTGKWCNLSKNSWNRAPNYMTRQP
jgi:hypothetical protein